MARKLRPNTAEVTIKFRVPKGFSAARARAFIKNSLDTEVFCDMLEAEQIGAEVVMLRVGAAKIIHA